MRGRAEAGEPAGIRTSAVTRGGRWSFGAGRALLPRAVVLVTGRDITTTVNQGTAPDLCSLLISYLIRRHVSEESLPSVNENVRES